MDPSIFTTAVCVNSPVPLGNNSEIHHDTKWGIPAKSDDELFERISRQMLQAALNWKIILNKRESFNRAFRDFRIDRVSQFGEEIVAAQSPVCVYAQGYIYTYSPIIFTRTRFFLIPSNS